MSDNKLLKVVDLKKWYETKVKINDKKFGKTKKQIKAVDGISFELKTGEILGIIGESGCGKSTLGKLLINLEEPTSGNIFIHGVSTQEIFKKDSLKFRRMVQVIFQNPFDSFDPRNTIKDILESTLKLHSIGSSYIEREEIVKSSIEEVGLKPAENFLSRYPHELSGGQLQRIAIVKAMMLEPDILIADEAVSMLDVSVRAEIIKLLKKLTKSKGTTLIFISHDINTTSYISEKIAVMYLGEIVEFGSTQEVLEYTQHPYTKVLLSNSSTIDLNDDKEVISISGEPPSPIDTGPGCYFAPRCYMAKEVCFNSHPDFKERSLTHKATCHFAKSNMEKETINIT
ncbi:MAG TPA: ATP-binding cassette domain-containing protein [Aliicoccus persicus]|uniref:ATP-binding cassette domain-containing protein n=1 Tax=Aliicoccus persicus TaxID=930138 RepID=A0A921DYE0_9STAP|nr:ATP-binding cassette domain-containing protein [Aliicoccus persicus]